VGIMSELAAWESFYVIVGSEAGALIGPRFLGHDVYRHAPTDICGGCGRKRHTDPGSRIALFIACCL
jgi:hypothetical protein